MGTNLKVLSLNIHKGFNWTNQEFILLNIRELIREEDADLVFLQEVVGENIFFSKETPRWPKEPQFEFLSDQVWNHFSYGKNAVYPHGHHGNAILSKYPIKYYHNENISTHFFEQRGLLHCEIAIPTLEEKVHLFCTHLNMFLWRTRQLKMVSDYIEKSTGDSSRVILAGDFNDWNGSVKKVFEQKLGLQDLLPTSTKTFPVIHPILRLDGIYSRNITHLQSSVFSHKPWTHWSDHLAVKTLLSL